MPSPPRRLVLLLLAIATPLYAAASIKVTIASDSTACAYGSNEARGRRGWGEILPEFLSSNVVIDNQAASGRSSKSFIDEGRWAGCLAANANYYFIQFAHNDSKTSDPALGTDPQTTYKANLIKFVTESRAQGGKPVFLTPPTRRNFSSEHVLATDTLQDYATAMCQVGVAYNVPVLDVLPTSIEFFQFVGKTKTPPYQSTVTAGSGTTNDDTTHFCEQGARQHCYLIVEAILRSTHADLAAIQSELRKQGVALPVTVATASTVQFQGSFDLATWTNYGTATSISAPGLTRYLFDCGDTKVFFRAVATTN